MATIRYLHRHLDVACQLDQSEAGARADEWQTLRETAGLGVEPLADGARLWLRPEARAAAEDLARREVNCCGFLDLELATESDRLRLDITSPAREAGTVIASLTGLDADC